jgi:hypothetical protein
MKEKKKVWSYMNNGIIRLVWILGVCFLIFSCGPTPGDDDEDSGLVPSGKMFVVTSDFSTGGFGLIDLDDLTPWKPDPSWAAQVVAGDAVAKSYNQKVYVINRYQMDSISVLEFSSDDEVELVNQYSVKGDDTSSNPYDLEFALEDQAYLTRYGSDKLWMINPQTGELLEIIDLSAYADDDGIPEMAFMIKRGIYLFVAIQRLDEDNWWVPVGDSYLLRINMLTNEVDDTILLTCTNPVTDLVWNDDLGRIMVGEAGNYGILDGCIDAIDPVTGEVESVITENELGGDISEIAVVSDTKAYAGVTTTDWANSIVVEFNPHTGQVSNPEVYKTSACFPFVVELDDSDRLYITEGDPAQPGVIILDTDNNQVLTADPVEFDLPPYWLELVK